MREFMDAMLAKVVAFLSRFRLLSEHNVSWLPKFCAWEKTVNPGVVRIYAIAFLGTIYVVDTEVIE